MESTKKALITGITGQDGSYLAELLLEKGYEVHGVIRRSSSFNTGRIMHIFQDVHEQKARLKLHYGDLSDASCLEKILDQIEPQEVYNLAAQSHVRVSFDEPIYTADICAMGALRLLEAIKNIGATKSISCNHQRLQISGTGTVVSGGTLNPAGLFVARRSSVCLPCRQSRHCGDVRN